MTDQEIAYLLGFRRTGFMSKYLMPVIYPRHREAVKAAYGLAANKLYGCRYHAYPKHMPPSKLRFK